MQEEQTEAIHQLPEELNPQHADQIGVLNQDTTPPEEIDSQPTNEEISMYADEDEEEDEEASMPELGGRSSSEEEVLADPPPSPTTTETKLPEVPTEPILPVAPQNELVPPTATSTAEATKESKVAVPA